MFERRSLKWPIVLGIVMILLVVASAAGWVLVTFAGATTSQSRAGLYWTLLTVGSIVFAAILGGTIAYLTISIKAINLNRRQSNFIDSVTHELKSPIASLKLVLQTLSRRPVSDQQRSDFHRYMLDDIERLDELINRLLDAARLDRKPDRLREACDLGQLLAEAAVSVEMRYRLPAGTVQIEGDPLVIYAPPVDLNIIFRNLLDNAVKYGGDPPRVQVASTLTAGGEALVRIADNGPGIPPALRRKIFGRFVRLGNELERSRPGTGLGLYLVRNLVGKLGGTVRITGREPESGTVFEVTFPRNTR